MRIIHGRGARGGVVAASVVALGLSASVVFAGGGTSVAVSPASKDFGLVSKGSGALQAFVLKNNGASVTGPLQVSLSGSPAFSKSADTCATTSLAPQKQCTVTVQYAPTDISSTDIGTL